MIEAVQSRQRELPQVFAEIINNARRRAGVTTLSDDALRSEIQDWTRILAPVPPDKIDECYIRVMRHRTVKAILQPAELLSAWTAMRDDNAAIRARPEAGVDKVCYYCGGTGWQTVIQQAEHSDAMNEYARPCACSNALRSKRSEFPLREPNWTRDRVGRWHKAS